MLNGNFVFSFFCQNINFDLQFRCGDDARTWQRAWLSDRASERENDRERQASVRYTATTIPFNFNFITSLINYVVHIVRSVSNCCHCIQTHSLSQTLTLTKPYWDIVSTRWRFDFHCLFTIIKFSKELISERL